MFRTGLGRFPGLNMVSGKVRVVEAVGEVDGVRNFGGLRIVAHRIENRQKSFASGRNFGDLRTAIH